MFLVDPTYSDIGTITAWNDGEIEGRDIGRIHWVAIVREAQGRGLAKPMLSAAIDVLQTLGYTEAWLWTGTAPIEMWPQIDNSPGTPPITPINLYRSFGFEPYLRNDADRATWRAFAPHLKLPLVI
jgi:GNAT superfamily N-acetyltransferase